MLVLVTNHLSFPSYKGHQPGRPLFGARYCGVDNEVRLCHATFTFQSFFPSHILLAGFDRVMGCGRALVPMGFSFARSNPCSHIDAHLS